MNIGDIPTIHNALLMLVSDKFTQDGYIDMSTLGYDYITKQTATKKLEAIGSVFAHLFKELHPSSNGEYKRGDSDDTFCDLWQKYIGSVEKTIICTVSEANYIVSYFNYLYGNNYRLNGNSMKFWLMIFNLHINKMLDSHITPDIRTDNATLIYDSKQVIIKHVDTVPAFLSFIMSDISTGENSKIFFRGHSLMNYQLLPSIMRKDTSTGMYDLLKNEQQLFNEIQYRCPEEFSKCKTHLEKLTIMQHYGLPTRLLDITTNPLVALYFACSSEQHEKRYGEVVLLSVEKDHIKWASSDTVSILASMAALSYNDNDIIARDALYYLPRIPELGVHTSRADGVIKYSSAALKKLLGEVRTEKPGFEERVLAKDILSTQFVYAMQNNRRINNQSGAFILFGEPQFKTSLYHEGITSTPANHYRVKTKQSKVIVLCIENKKRILKQLDLLGVNEETMFPEIEDVSKAIVKKL